MMCHTLVKAGGPGAGVSTPPLAGISLHNSTNFVAGSDIGTIPCGLVVGSRPAKIVTALHIPEDTMLRRTTVASLALLAMTGMASAETLAVCTEASPDFLNPQF